MGTAWKRWGWLAAGLASLLMAGCDRSAPYVQPIHDYNMRVNDPKPGPLGEEQRRVVKVCYSSSDTTADEIRRLAAEECFKRGLALGPVLMKDTLGCSVAQPSRAHFACVNAPPAPPPPPRPGTPFESRPMADPDPPPDLPPHLRPGAR